MASQDPVNNKLIKANAEIFKVAAESKSTKEDIDRVLDKATEDGTLKPWDIINFDAAQKWLHVIFDSRYPTLKGKIEYPIDLDDFPEYSKEYPKEKGYMYPGGPHAWAYAQEQIKKDPNWKWPSKNTYPAQSDTFLYSGDKALLLAITNENLEGVTRLLERGGDPNKLHPDDLLKALLSINDVNKVEQILKMLIEHEYDPNKKFERATNVTPGGEAQMSFAEILGDQKMIKGFFDRTQHYPGSRDFTEEDNNYITAFTKGLTEVIQNTPNAEIVREEALGSRGLFTHFTKIKELSKISKDYLDKPKEQPSDDAKSKRLK